MSRIVFIGGVGSNTRTMDRVQQALMERHGEDVIVLSFNEALQDLAYVAQIVRDSTVITHSAGMSLLEDMTPGKLIAVAPPMPASSLSLMIRVIKKTSALHRSGSSSDRKERVREYHIATLRENVTKPHFIVRRLSAICAFNAAMVSVKLLQRRVPVTVGIMEHDLLFPRSRSHNHMIMASGLGVIIHELPGHHDEFLLDPAPILDRLMPRQQ